jgi:hypothetical protein
MEYMIIAVAIAILATVVTLVMIAYRRDCRKMGRAVERLESGHLSVAVNAGRPAQRAA